MRNLIGSWSVYAALVLAAAVLAYLAGSCSRRPVPAAGASDPSQPAPNAYTHPGAFRGPSVRDVARATGGDPDDAE